MKILVDETEHTFESFDSLESHLIRREGNWQFLELKAEENQEYGFRINLVLEADDGCAFTIGYFPKENPSRSFFYDDDYDTHNLDRALWKMREFIEDQKSMIENYKWVEISPRVTNRNTLFIIGAILVFLAVVAIFNKN